ncbi:hypothetical protein FGIG_08026 [Fasciola gigantica]|uniref:EF-hand domain-containing protein n=1 Tax=Fasciola gigantica TaxID=46835 RepID=A0A504YTR5_FASGI|nr:hypothetical protein FGIG_08026 [Fasciola gigantica]
MENKQTPQALAYLFRILDMGGRGRLTGLTLRHFYVAVEQRLRGSGHSPPCFNDIQDEIFDMVGPANPSYITLDDLIRCLAESMFLLVHVMAIEVTPHLEQSPDGAVVVCVFLICVEVLWMMRTLRASLVRS